MPAVDLIVQEVRVNFYEELFNSSDTNIEFSSNCTATIQVNYNHSVKIPIPYSKTTTEVCQYSIQLLHKHSQVIGYPILGTYQYSQGILHNVCY